MTPPLPPGRIATVFSGIAKTMLDLEFALSSEKSVAPALFWSTAIIAMPGKQPIAVAVSSDQNGCATLGAAMFSCALDEVDTSMANDALSELTNVTAGELKRALSLDQAIGLPRTVAGLGLSSDPSTGVWNVICLSCTTKGVNVLVSISTKHSTVEEYAA